MYVTGAGEPPRTLCQCPCLTAHPDQPEICRMFSGTEILLLAVPEFGLAGIPVCQPCFEVARVNQAGG